MHADNKETLENRAVRAAETALARNRHVSAIDVLTGMGLLAESHVDAWRKGRIEFLERMIQASPKKISQSVAAFHKWAEGKGLRPTETPYVRWTPSGTVNLRFSEVADPSIEKIYRTHFVSPELSQQKQEKLEERLTKAPQPVVFQIVRDSQCSECGVELWKDSLLLMEGEQPLCLPCARLGDLEYLPAGDTALTRRSSKYSTRAAVVVRFSRSRGRYERQGLLVEKVALEKAELECTEDADQRARERAVAAERRRGEDREFVVRMMEQLLVLFPGCPPGEARAIAGHTAVRGSGRVGRSAAGKNLEERALTDAAAAAIRHQHTDYDELLAGGVDRGLARERVAGRVQDILEQWRSSGTTR